MTHTPGPWDGYVGKHSGSPSALIAHSESMVVVARLFPFEVDEPTMNANARLIAAAPDLLEALEAMVAQECDYMKINNLGDPEEQHNIMLSRIVIAKAKGE